jgi:four helix bundle protein
MTPPYDIQERTFEFAVQVVLFCGKVSKMHTTTGVLARQLLKSATSVGANMEEADGAQTKPDFRTKVSTAKKEAKETVYWLRLIAATDAAARDRVLPLLAEANQIASIVTAIKRKADASANRGTPIGAFVIAAVVHWTLT